MIEKTVPPKELEAKVLTDFRKEFFASDKNRLAQNVASRSDPLETCMRRATLESTSHVFNYKIDEVKPVTNQHTSGRCWIFSCLNAMRIPFMKKLELEDFEFSQSYVFFWDKIERCNYFLNTVADVFRRETKEEPDGRLVSFLLHDPINDGGQWDMVVNIIEKHGLMPKKCFPESFSCESSRRMNQIIKSKMREFARDIHVAIVQDKADNDTVHQLIRSQMAIVYRIVGICLGIPPETFTWEYYDKSKRYHKVGPISPQSFYNDHVRQHFDVQAKVCLVTDPRPDHPTGKTYTVDCLGNVVGGKKTIYNNQTVETLMQLAANSIKAGEPVWFGCDVAKFLASKQGFLTLDVYDYELVFDTNVYLGMNKADRLIYGDSEMTHAMVLTGVHLEDDVTPTKWRVENSWGEDRNAKGYISMTNEWFKEFVFEIVVDKAHCTKEILDVFQIDPVVLPAWDPLGSLA